MADDLLDEDTRASWQGHLAQCGVCRELLAALVDDDQPALVEPPQPGDKVDRYEIIECVGIGGFGLVYRAYDPKLDRDVALKLWRVDTLGPTGSGSKGAEALVSEARALAKLSHPNVMAIYDAGRDGEQVFLAGELIEGTPLSSYIGEESGTRALSWMRQCAEGLAAAHAVGLIHRDIKPDNIIVGKDGRARIVDFGLATNARSSAKMAAVSDAAEIPNLGLRETLTMAGPLVGTPAYMAPEQFGGQGANAASDQYSLCASFYEVVHGHRAAEADSFAQLRARVMSQKLPELRKGLPAPLGTALLKGLARQPEDRYGKVSEIVQALTPPSVGRGRLYLALALALSAVLAFVLLRSSDSTLRDCTLVASDMDSIWNAGEKASLKKQFASFGSSYSGEAYQRVVGHLDGYAQNWKQLGVNSCKASFHEQRLSESMFDRQMLCLERRRGEMQHLVSLFKETDKTLLERAPRAITQLVDLQICTDPERLGAMDRLPSNPEERQALVEVEKILAQAEALRMAGKYDDAHEQSMRALALAKTLNYAPTMAEASFELGFISSYRNDAEAAKEHLGEAHYKAVAARDLRTSARAAIELVYVYGTILKDVERAEEWARHASSAIEAGGNAKQLEANLESNLGDLALGKADTQGALQHNRRALELRIELHGKEDRGVAQSLNNLGLAYNLSGDYIESSKKYTEAHRVFAKVLGPHHPYVGLTAGNLGSIYVSLGRVAEAKQRFQEAYDIARDSGGEKSYGAIRAKVNLAVSIESLGEREKASTMLEELALLANENLPEDFGTQALIANSRGVTASNRSRYEDALSHFLSARALHLQYLNEEHPEVLLVDVNVAQTEGSMGRTKESLARFELLVPRFEKAHGEKHPQTAWVLMSRAEQYLNVRRPDAALADLRRVKHLYSEIEVAPEQRWHYLFLLGQALHATGDDEGVKLVREALVGYEELGAEGESGAKAARKWLQSNGLKLK